MGGAGSVLDADRGELVDGFGEELEPRVVEDGERLGVGLDAVLDEMLVDREQKLMSAVPVFLERRFEALRRQQSVGWPDVFDEEMRQLLLAELDDRLQPVAGLVEAFSNVHKSQP